MINYNYALKSLTFFLVIVLLTYRLGSFTHEVFVGPIQEHISHKQIISADQSDRIKPVNIFKFKRVFLDASLEGAVEIVITPPSPLPVSYTRFTPKEPQAVYLDIQVPPDEPGDIVPS